MDKKNKVKYLIKELETLFPVVPVPLDHKDPYTLLIAVLLSAQCTDERVNQITPKLFEKADNPYEMVNLTVEEIKEIIRPCIEKHNGLVPTSFEDLEELPGVGHKTASVVMSQAFGFPAFPVDTHIHRLMYRWGLSNGSNVKQTEKDAKRIFPQEKWNKLHLQIIFYARKFSPARGWDINKDFITKKIGRKSILNKLV